MKKLFSLLISVAMLLSCFPVVNVAAEGGEALTAKAYILNDGGETTNIYVTFNEKITDYSTATLWNRYVNGELITNELSTVEKENDYTLKYTIAGPTGYVTDWNFKNVQGTLHYIASPKAGTAELALADSVTFRGGVTGWAEVAKNCYTVPYEIVTSMDGVALEPGTNEGGEVVTSDPLKAQAYIVNDGSESTSVYVVFNKKITDYSGATLWNRYVNGELITNELSTVEKENDYTLKYTIAGPTGYVTDWNFKNVQGTLHYIASPKAGETELSLVESVVFRGGVTGWAEVAKNCYTVPYEIVDSVEDVPMEPAVDEDDEVVTSDPLKAQAYIVNDGSESTSVYVVFNKKITDYSGATLWNRYVNGELITNELSTVAKENDYTLKYTIAGSTGYITDWNFKNVQGSLHYVAAPVAGEEALALNESVNFRGGLTGWAEVTKSCYTVPYEIVDSVEDVPASLLENTGDDNTGDDNTGDDNTGDDNTGDDNTGDDNTGDDNTGSDTPAVVTPLAGKVYTVKGQPTKVYLVFNQKLTKTDGTSIVLSDGNATKILAVTMTVVNDHVISFENVDYPLSICLKNGYNGAQLGCYIYGNGVEGENGAKLPAGTMNIPGWDGAVNLYLFEYAGEVDSVDALPSLDNAEGGDNAGTGDTMAVGAVVVVACAAALIAVSKKKHVR